MGLGFSVHKGYRRSMMIYRDEHTWIRIDIRVVCFWEPIMRIIRYGSFMWVRILVETRHESLVSRSRCRER